MPLRILLADDQQLIRDGIKALLEQEGFEVVGMAVNGQEAVQLAQTLNPDVALLDLIMPVLSGVEAGEQILRVCPRTRVLLLTMHANDHLVVEALKAGIRGYVVKTQAVEDLVDAIRAVTGGGIYLSPRISRDAVHAYFAGAEPRPETLAPRAP